jgi:hypothetical protein
MALLVSSVYYAHMHDIMHRCRVYPLTADIRIRFVLAGMVRTRVILSLGGTALFALVVLFHTPWQMLIVAAGLGLAGFAAVGCIWSILLLVVTRHAFSPGALFIPFGLIVFAVATLVATSTMVDLLAAFPVAGWVALGILGAARGEVMPPASAAGACLLLIVFVLWLGRRYA